ncbi:hypothetical protein EYD10_01688 [Varanus komodoensis]|nr:hypothetical protein EYD10_01688 [Varanus komodoensis]
MSRQAAQLARGPAWPFPCGHRAGHREGAGSPASRAQAQLGFRAWLVLSCLLCTKEPQALSGQAEEGAAMPRVVPSQWLLQNRLPPLSRSSHGKFAVGSKREQCQLAPIHSLSMRRPRPEALKSWAERTAPQPACKWDRPGGLPGGDPGAAAASLWTEQNHVEEVRLRPAVSHANRPLPVMEGIVEVRRRSGWAQICDENWDSRNSRVICGMLGFPAEKRVNRNFYKLLTQHQQLNYWLHSVDCRGHEAHLSLCSFEFYKGNTTGACQGGMPAVVSCIPGPLFVPASNTHKKKRRQQQQQQRPQRVRLKGGARPSEGRVEVLKDGEWGTVCDDRWNLVTASVVCRELGFGSAKEALTGARMGQGMGQIHLNEVQCLGFEKTLWSCPRKNITQEDCKHTEDAGVRCNVPYMGFETTIRIVGGRTTFEGRVEVKRAGKWGTVCSTGWGTTEAMVACRQLGLGYAMHAVTETWYWDASNVTEMVLSGVKCSGQELALSQCQQHRAVNCQKTGTRFAAGVICSETSSDLLLHAPLVQETAYIEDRPLHMLYCAAEENCLSSSARHANWPYGHRRLLRFSSQIHNTGRADFRPKAGRHSWVWHECHGHYHSMDVFTHYDLLTPNGTKVAEGHKASFCLEDTECQEDVGKRYECANFGEQGIAVGCWDLYRHDIDCQWIDITDVKPGNYILQVVINPRYEVAESDFTNNAMKCNCKYDGHRIWVHSCHIGDALSEEASKRFEQYPGQLNNQIV